MSVKFSQTYLADIIESMESFRSSPRFNIAYDVTRRILIYSEKLSFIFDNEIHRESVADYLGLKLNELQLVLLNLEATLLECLLQLSPNKFYEDLFLDIEREILFKKSGGPQES